jgi:hypothetical protein
MKSTLREIGEWLIMLAIIAAIILLIIYKG